MKVLHYADQHIVTGDAIATLVLDYAQALALAGRSDVIQVPALHKDRLPDTYEFLVGPASQIVASDADPIPGPELIDDEFETDIRQRIAALTNRSHHLDEASFMNADAGDPLLRDSSISPTDNT